MRTHLLLEPLTPDQARERLREELTGREYATDGNLLERLERWFTGLFDSDSSVGQLSGLSLVALCVVALALVIGVLVLIARVRSDRGAAVPSATVLPSTRRSAQEHRASAEAALAGGDLPTAVLEAFRALAMRLVESGQLDDNPGATATELVGQMVRLRPDLAEPMRDGARLFDEVHYGERRPSEADVAHLLGLDDRLARSRR